MTKSWFCCMVHFRLENIYCPGNKENYGTNHNRPSSKLEPNSDLMCRGLVDHVQSLGNWPSLYLQPDTRLSRSRQSHCGDRKQSRKRYPLVSQWPGAAAAGGSRYTCLSQSLLWVMMFLFSTTFFPPLWNGKGISHIWRSGVAELFFFCFGGIGTV